MDQDIYNQLAKSIIEHQEAIMGPVAVQQAMQVQNMSVDWGAKSVVIKADPLMAIDKLVDQYKVLFGQISVEVCKEAVGRLAQQLTPEQMPASLR